MPTIQERAEYLSTLDDAGHEKLKHRIEQWKRWGSTFDPKTGVLTVDKKNEDETPPNPYSLGAVKFEALHEQAEAAEAPITTAVQAQPSPAVKLLRLYSAELEAMALELGKRSDRDNPRAEEIEEFSRGFCLRHRAKPRYLYSLLRLSTLGETESLARVPIFELMEKIGQERLHQCIRLACLSEVEGGFTLISEAEDAPSPDSLGELCDIDDHGTLKVGDSTFQVTAVDQGEYLIKALPRPSPDLKALIHKYSVEHEFKLDTPIPGIGPEESNTRTVAGMLIFAFVIMLWLSYLFTVEVQLGTWVERFMLFGLALGYSITGLLLGQVQRSAKSWKPPTRVGGYRPNRKVDPRTVRPPKGPSAVTPPESSS